LPGIDLSRVKSMLFVCLGNTCRSPAAEGFARKFARESSPPEEFSELQIESAGLYHSFLKAQPQSIQFVKQIEGEDISPFRSRVITEDMVRHFDVIITMETYMKSVICAQFPVVEELQLKIITLKESCQDDLKPSEVDIPDPYLMPDYVYFPILEEIRVYTRCLVNKWVSARQGSQSKG
jgi:protein-tyrosine phosphatase